MLNDGWKEAFRRMKGRLEEFERRVAELDRDSEPWELAELYEAQEVIDPRETRQYLMDMLEIYRDRMSGGIGQHLISNWPTSFV